MRARQWLYGLTADEWLHLAAEGDDSEVAPCCANLSAVREALNALAVSQGADDYGWQLSAGRRLLKLLGDDGYGHGLDDRARFPLLHQVLDGIREQQAGLRQLRAVPGRKGSHDAR